MPVATKKDRPVESSLTKAAAQGTPGAIVEQGDTKVLFDSPIDSRTFDYVNGRCG